MNVEKERRRIILRTQIDKSEARGRKARNFYFEGWRKDITLLEFPHVFYAHLSDKSTLKMKTPEWRYVVF